MSGSSPSQGYTLSSQSVGAPIVIAPTAFNAGHPAVFPPGVYVTLSAGASLTYNVEVTGDASQSLSPTGNWNGLDTATGQTASGQWSINAACVAVRLNITNYVSGSATVRMVQW